MKINKIIEFDEELQQTSLVDGNLCEDKSGNIWLAILPQLFKIKPDMQTETFFAEECGDVGKSNVLAEKDSLIRIYTDNGFYKYDINNEEFMQYSTNDGLANNSINSIIDDKRGNLYAIWHSISISLISGEKASLIDLTRENRD